MEVYHFLSHACNIYLPSYDTVTVWHLRDLLSKKRTRIMGTDVKHIHVPQYEGLKVEAMLDFASQYPEVMRVFPESRKETMKMPRQYIANCIHSIIGKPFSDWVNEKVNERHKKVLDDREMGIEMDQELYAIFMANKAVSTSNGNSYNLLKSCSKRRRGKEQIKAEKLEVEQKMLDTAKKLADYEAMQQRLAQNIHLEGEVQYLINEGLMRLDD